MRTAPAGMYRRIGMDKSSPTAAPGRELSLLDASCIIVGIVIGSAIFEAAPTIAQNAGSPAWLFFAWGVGGVIALVGSLVYAELAVAYPEDGGEYVYLQRAFGRQMGVFYCWAQLWIVRPGSIGAVGFVFARYANQLFPLDDAEATSPWTLVLYATLAIVVATAVNVLGVREGKWTQNTLTVGKVVGILAICLAGLFASPGVSAEASAEVSVEASAVAPGSFTLAMILIMFTYGGWNDMPLVAAEVRDPGRNLVRALVLGTVSITFIYFAVNAAYMHALGYAGLTTSQAVAADVLAHWLGAWGSRAVSALICVSCLGAINGMVLTGSRIYYAMGRDHRLFAWLGKWNARCDSPLRALLFQAAITVAVVVGFGMYADGFDRMVVFTVPAFWFFFTATGVSLFILRRRDPAVSGGFRVPFYPLTPLLFCISSLGMLISSLDYGWENRSPEAAWAIGILAVGVLVSWKADALVSPGTPPDA